MLKKIRVLTAVLVLMLATLLFLDFTGTIHLWFGWIAKIQLVPAIFALHIAVVAVLILLTLLFGRLYCSIICPLGLLQDAASKVASKRKKHRFSFSKPVTWLRISMLIIFILAFLLGFNSIVALIAPYSSFGRIISNLFAPLWQMGNNVLAYFAERANSYAFYETEMWIKSLYTFIISIVTLLIIGYLAWRGGRTYCNTICPVGTLLGYISKFSLLKIRLDKDKCNSCGLCARNCKSSCINSKDKSVDYTRCVSCFNCIERCNKGAVSYSLAAKAVETNNSESKDTIKERATDNTRRNFLTVSALFGASIISAQDKKGDGGVAPLVNRKAPTRNTSVVPSGAKSIKNFNTKCTACQLCVSVCPNGVLRPSANLDRLMQPEMSFERGYCRPECTKCSEVCPTGAITKVTREEKSAISIGTAVWIERNCVVVNDAVTCGNCEANCPSGAIQMVKYNNPNNKKLTIPTVNTERCIGCGACEYVCPSSPYSSIYVEGNIVHRTI